MLNPFTTPLAFGPNAGYDFPSGDTDIYPSEQEPDFEGLGGGASAYRGTQSSVQKTGYPSYAGTDELRYADSPGIVYPRADLAPAPGSTDLTAARESGGIPGTDRAIMSMGPVTGLGSEFSGDQTALNTPNPGYAGPVTGGPDYSSVVTANWYASQAQAYSDQASANALLVSF